jgi:hypothetical protein
MSPIEIVTIFIHHLRRADRERSARGTFYWEPAAPMAFRDLGARAFRLLSWTRLNGG